MYCKASFQLTPSVIFEPLCVHQFFQGEIAAADERLDLTSDEQNVIISKQIPQGEPILVTHVDELPVTQDVCKLVQEDYVSGFSHELGMPLWSSFTLTQEQVYNYHFS